MAASVNVHIKSHNDYFKNKGLEINHWIVTRNVPNISLIYKPVVTYDK